MQNGNRTPWWTGIYLLIVVMVALVAGCNEWDTLKREVLTKAQKTIFKKKNPFVPRDGITTRACSLYQTANPNSEFIRLPGETPVHLLDKVGDWYRVRTREGREGYLDQKVVGGDDMILKTQDLRKSIEGMSPQAEGVTKSKANFRLEAGREHAVVEVFPPGKKFEVYERVVTLRHTPASKSVGGTSDQESSVEDAAPGEVGPEDERKDVWYKVKMEDGRVGYIYTHNIRLTPPADIAKVIPYLRMVAWKSVNVTEDPDLGAKNNYLVAYAKIGKDPGCDFTELYYMNWSPKLKRRNPNAWNMRVAGILPIGGYQFEGKPGFSVRYLHPSKKDKLVQASFVLSKGQVQKVSEEEIPNPSQIH